ncbi:MAG: hypothetical protein QGF90_06900 [Gammaproteobacteria bacterium]|nr:hypothetical protein [Gammaproteobacteria bacterium]
MSLIVGTQGSSRFHGMMTLWQPTYYKDMRAYSLKTSLSLTFLSTLLCMSQLSAQQPEPEVEAGAEAEQTGNTGNRLLYIDLPVALEEGLDPVFPEPLPPADPQDDPEFLRRLDTIRQYSSAVDSIEQAGGAWDRALVEELSAMGSLQQQQGEHAEAIETLNRAVHVNRINAGLHTLEQIPAIEIMIDSYIAIGDWRNADLYNNYLFFVQRKAFGADDPRIIPVLDRLANWHMQAFNIGYGESLGSRLSTAQILFKAAARMVSVHFGRADERFVDLKTNIARSAYLVSRYPEYMAELERPEARTMEDLLRESLNEQGRMLPRGFLSGEAALQDIIDYYDEESSSVYGLAEAITSLGDWYIIFERRRAAEQRYAQAYQLLLDQDNGEELIKQLFGQVAPIPTFRLPTNLEKATSHDPDPSGLHSDYADLSFDVTANGAVRNVRMLTEITDENSLQLVRLRREARFSSFRPKVVDGRPVRTDDNQFRYRYWY